MGDEDAFLGTWQVTELLPMAPDYLEQSPNPHVTIAKQGPVLVIGVFAFGPQQGEMDCHFKSIKKGRKAQHAIMFTFTGTAGEHPINGYGKGILIGGDVVKGEMLYHKMGKYQFVWKKQPE